MGVVGAAVSTVMSQAVSVVISVIYLYRYKESFSFDFKPSHFRIDRDKFKMLIKVGTPLALQYTAISISVLFVNSNINAYCVIAAAVSGVGNNIENMAGIITNGINSANGTMIGQNLGAGKQNRAKHIVYVSLIISAVFYGVNIVAALLFPRQIFSLFNTKPEVLDMAVTFMRIEVWVFIASMFMGPYGSMVTGCGFTALNMTVGVADSVAARIGLSLLFGEVMGLGLIGYFYGNALARLVGAVILIAYFYSGRWRTRKLLVERVQVPMEADING